MKLNERDRWLLAVLPAIVTAMYYIWSPGKRASQEHKAAEAQYQSALQTQLRPEALTANIKKLSDAEDKLNVQQDLAAKLKEAAKPTAVLPNVNRTEALQKVASILDHKQLGLLKRRRIANPEREDAADSAVKLAGQLNLPAPEYWQFELTGRYSDMQDALEAMDKCGTFVVPIGIGMEALDDAGTQKWTLTLWI